MKRDLFKALSIATLCSFMLAFASCANENIVQKKTDTDNNDKNLTTFVTGTEPTSRTSMDYNSGAFYWEAGDYIYVKDDDNVWQKSKNAPTSKTAYFKFKVDGRFNNSATYKVYYPGKNGSNDQVTIPAAQTQIAPNTTAHFGESGDCGTADATGTIGGKSFSFKLDHQAAYLVFLPYTGNTVLHNCYLTKIEVTSDKDITNTYTLDPITGELTGTGSGKQIVLTTGSSGTYANGFPLTNTSASIVTNGAFMVIKPGTHILNIRYWVKDISTHIEGTITKKLGSFNYKKNTYYDMTANLNVTNYDGNHYYMWDAQQQYWYGYEWTKNLPVGTGQPTLMSQPAGNYAQNNSDNRWYHESSYLVGRVDATMSCAGLPNVNEMWWYAMKGDPRWDGDELWTTMGHLYKGGMWFLKHNKISGYSKEHNYDGIDLRTTPLIFVNNSLTPGLPSASEANNYFYLPALGCYMSGSLVNVGFSGEYFSSSARPHENLQAYGISFYSDRVAGGNRPRFYGLIAQPFSDFGDE